MKLALFPSKIRLYRKLCAVFLAVLILVGSATAAEAPEIKRRYNNSTRLRAMHPYMQPKVGAILADMESHGFKPVIHSDVYRSPQKQAQLKKVGFSKVGYSFHMVTDWDDSRKIRIPASFAADIIDNYVGYNVGNGFWLRLASSAQSHGLGTGIFWGLREAERAKIRRLMQAKIWNVSFRRGWDPAHCQPLSSVLTLSQAKSGVRPPMPRRTRPELSPVNPQRVSPSGLLLERK